MPIKLNGTTFNNGGSATFNGTPLSEIRFGSTTVWKKETNLWVDGATSESGGWTTVKNNLDRGQTIAFGTSITSTNADNIGNSFHGTLIYPSNKVAVTQGSMVYLSIASTNQYPPVIYCVDTNVTKWTFYVSIVYMSSVPSDFHSTFDINAWVEGKDHNTLVNVWGSGSDASKQLTVDTYSGTVPVTGSYYPCIVVHGYDSKTYQLGMNNFKIV